MHDDQLETADLFLFDFGMGLDDDGRFRGHLKATGLRPQFADRLSDLGVLLDDDLFEAGDFIRKAASA
jgi:pilus assembly protein CpaF